MPVLSLACHLSHNTPHIPSRYNNEQTTKQTKAINNSYIYINISCKCDTNRAGHFTLDAYASRPVACLFIGAIRLRMVDRWFRVNFKGIMMSTSINITGHNNWYSWWRHQMEIFSALLAICAGNSPVTGEFPSQRPMTRSFHVFFDLRLNKRLSKQSIRRWFVTPSHSLWCHCGVLS